MIQKLQNLFLKIKKLKKHLLQALRGRTKTLPPSTSALKKGIVYVLGIPALLLYMISVASSFLLLFLITIQEGLIPNKASIALLPTTK